MSLLERTKNAGLRLLIWAALLGAWEGAFRVVGWKPWVFPAPSHVVDALVAMLGVKSHYALPAAIVISVTRLLAGFALSTVLGILLGVTLWRWRGVDKMFGGFFLGLQTLPSVCWVPLSVLVFGFNETGILFVLVMGSAFAMAIGFRDGLRTIPPVYEKAGLMMGARGATLYLNVILPASMPAFASSLRQGFSFAWRSLMGAELIFMVHGQGIGYLLHQGREFSDIAQVIATMAVMIGFGMIFDRAAFAPLERRVHSRFGLAPNR
jgi:NitT/TauT family transport system permease protein